MITAIVQKIRLLAAMVMLGVLTLQPVFAQDEAITVLAAASLKESLEEAGKIFSTRDPAFRSVLSPVSAPKFYPTLADNGNGLRSF